MGVVRKQCGWSLLAQALGAAGWGIFFSISPIVEALFLTAILWIPLLLYLEFRRARRHGFLPGFLIRLATAALIVTAAAVAPVKWEDKTTVQGLSGQRVALAELSSAFRVPAERADLKITLPATAPTVRQAMRAVEEQTGLRCTIARCGNSATILWGAYPIGDVRIEEPLATAR